MEIPALLPDECSRGYVGRLRRFNGDPSLNLLQRQFARELQETEGKSISFSWTHVLAQFSGLGMERLIRGHSFIPFLRTVHAQCAGVQHGTAATPGQLTLAGIMLPSKAAYFCKECINEDLSFRDFAYWRRAHQLPGIIFCQKHRSSLYQIDGDAIVDGLPADFENVAHSHSDDVIKNARENPMVQRYADICNAFLESAHPIHPEQAAQRLSARATRLGLRLSTMGNRDNLSDYAAAVHGGSWLWKFSPALKQKQKGVFVARIDGPVISKHAPYHATLYALALAILWDSSEEALSEFYRPLDSTATQRRANANSINDPLQNIYGNTTRQELRLAIEAFATGSSLREACEMHSACQTKLESLLRTVVQSGVSAYKNPTKMH